MVRLPPLKALHIFETVGRLGSVAAAARELGVTPGAISQQLRRLEEALAVPLTRRQGGGIALTPQGQAYHADISHGFAVLREAQANLERGRAQDTLVISCLPSLATRWLGPRLFDWAGAAGTRVHLLSADDEPDFTRGEVDLRITYGAAAQRHPQWREMFTDWVVPVAAPALLAGGRVRQAADVLGLPLLAIDWGRAHLPPPGWADWAASLDLPAPAQGPLTFSLSSTAIEAALDGRGVALAQGSMLGEDLARGRLAIAWDHRLTLPAPYCLAWNPQGSRKAGAASFRRWLFAQASR